VQDEKTCLMLKNSDQKKEGAVIACKCKRSWKKNGTKRGSIFVVMYAALGWIRGAEIAWVGDWSSQCFEYNESKQKMIAKQVPRASDT